MSFIYDISIRIQCVHCALAIADQISDTRKIDHCKVIGYQERDGKKISSIQEIFSNTVPSDFYKSEGYTCSVHKNKSKQLKLFNL